MRVLIVSESYAPTISGVAISVGNEARFLASQGHQVTVLTPRQAAPPPDEAGITVLATPSVLNPFRKGSRMSSSVAGVVKKALKEVQPEVIHLHDPGVLASAVAHAAGTTPLIWTQHFLPAFATRYLPVFLQKRAAQSLVTRLTKLYRQAKVVIAPSTYVVDALSGQLPGVTWKVISNGVAAQEYKPVQRESNQLLYVGRLTADKQVHLLIQMLPLLPSATLVIIGDGAERETLEHLAKQLKVSERITFLGWQPSARIQEALSACSVFCMPCDIETESIATLEALMQATPVVVAQDGAVQELVAGERGFAVAAATPEAWAETVGYVLANQELAQKQALRARAWVLEWRSLEASMRLIGQTLTESVQV